MFFVLGYRKEAPGFWQLMRHKPFSTHEEAQALVTKIPKCWNVVIVNTTEGEQV